MRGKYITTTIRLAALSCIKSNKLNNVKETLAATGNHRVIWSKNNHTETTALIQQEAVLVC